MVRAVQFRRRVTKSCFVLFLIALAHDRVQLYQYLVDCRILEQLGNWLEPSQQNTLPALPVRTAVLDALLKVRSKSRRRMVLQWHAHVAR